MNKHLILTLAAGVALAGALRAEEAKPAAAAAPAAEAKPVAKNDAPGSLKAGNQLLDEAKWAEAAAYFEGIGEQSSPKREPFRLNNLALAQLQLGKFEDAIANASKAIEAKKDLAAAYNNLASAYVGAGKRDQAVEALKSGIEAVKAAGGDTAKMESNLKGIEDAIEMSKPKKVREAEAKAKAEAEKAAAAAAPAAEKK